MSGDPHNDPNAQGDAFKTLFVARVVSMLIFYLRPLRVFTCPDYTIKSSYNCSFLFVLSLL